MNAPIKPPKPSSSSCTSPPSKRTRRETSEVEADLPPPRPGVTSRAQVVFIECFAGAGGLTKAVQRVGFQVAPPQDVMTGGIDFTEEDQLAELWRYWASLREAGFQLAFHFAPPCSSFSAVRDRSKRTRLRSRLHPEGFDPEEPKTKAGNTAAVNTASSIHYLVNQLEAVGTLEQPTRSYMIPFLDSRDLLPEHEEIVLHQCRFGRPFKKPTSFLLFGGLELPALAKTCSSRDSCGRSFHTRLGFGAGSTSEAAEYPAGLISSYAGALHAFFHKEERNDPIERLTITTDGVLHRHIDRGSTTISARALRAKEDEESRAGSMTSAQDNNHRGS